MALIKCPECGREVSDKAVSCPQCGFPIASYTVKAVKKVPVKFWRIKKNFGSGVHGAVYVDDVMVGTLDSGERFTVELECGAHKLSVKTTSEVSIIRRMPLSLSTATVEETNKINVMTLNIPDNTRRVEVECDLRAGHIEPVDIKIVEGELSTSEGIDIKW